MKLLASDIYAMEKFLLIGVKIGDLKCNHISPLYSDYHLMVKQTNERNLHNTYVVRSNPSSQIKLLKLNKTYLRSQYFQIFSYQLFSLHTHHIFASEHYGLTSHSQTTCI